MRYIIALALLLVCSMGYADNYTIYNSDGSSAQVYDNGMSYQVYGSDGSMSTIYKN